MIKMEYETEIKKLEENFPETLKKFRKAGFRYFPKDFPLTTIFILS